MTVLEFLAILIAALGTFFGCWGLWAVSTMREVYRDKLRFERRLAALEKIIEGREDK